MAAQSPARVAADIEDTRPVPEAVRPAGDRGASRAAGWRTCS